MDVIDGMRTFVAVGQAGSFARAAERLGISRALTSKYVGQLEERLGTRLLNRTTRSVTLTEIGRNYLDRCVGLLEDFDDLESSAKRQQTVPRGRIRITAPATFGELFLSDAVADFTDHYPEITVDLSLADRYVNVVEEGFDLAIRIGELRDSSLIARRLTASRLTVCASPDYLRQHGKPVHPSDLTHHNCIFDSNLREGERWPFVIEGKRVLLPVASRIHINSARAIRGILLQGRGIGYCPAFLVGDDLRAGRLVRLLSEYETTGIGVYALYPHSRHVSTKVRVMIDFLASRIPDIFN